MMMLLILGACVTYIVVYGVHGAWLTAVPWCVAAFGWLAAVFLERKHRRYVVWDRIERRLLYERRKPPTIGGALANGRGRANH